MHHDELSIIKQTLTDFWSQLAKHQVTGLVLAYSGGLDSSVLLHLCKTAPVPVRAVHIHHGLQSAADAWQTHCQQTAAAWQIPLTITRLDTSPQAGESIEAWARKQRYQTLQATLKPGECLLTAHHQDDQAETLLIQLCRGAGIKGMAAMPAWRQLGQSYHARPLLTISRAQLAAYAKAHALNYCDDPSNADTRFLRNHIRHQVMPLLRQDFPEVQSNLARTARHCAETADLLTELASMDVPELQPGPLDIRHLLSLSIPRQKNVLRAWFAIQGFDMPSEKHLQALMTDVISSRYDKVPLLAWPGVEIRRYAHMLYAMQPLIDIQYGWQQAWDLQDNLKLPSNLGHILVDDVRDFIRYQPLTVRFRREGESVRVAGHKHHKSLKNLMQQYRVPPWLRDRTPLLFHGEYLVAIVGYYQAKLYRDA